MLLVGYSLRLCTRSASPITEGDHDVGDGKRGADVGWVVDAGAGAARFADAVGQSEVRTSRESPPSSPHQTLAFVGTRATVVLFSCCNTDAADSRRQTADSRQQTSETHHPCHLIGDSMKTVPPRHPITLETHDWSANNQPINHPGIPASPGISGQNDARRNRPQRVVPRVSSALSVSRTGYQTNDRKGWLTCKAWTRTRSEGACSAWRSRKVSLFPVVFILIP